MDGFTERFECFTTAVSRAYKCVQRIKNAETERMGLKGTHVMCLYYLGKSPDGLTASELCKLCNEDKAAVSRTILDLTEKGYITSAEADPKRKYRAKLALTESGRKRNTEIKQAIARAVDKASEGLDQTERECFYKVFFTITDNLEKLCR